MAGRTGRIRRPVDPEAFRYRVLSSWLTFATAARRSTGLLAAFVVGIWVNTASDPDVRSFTQYLDRIYDVHDRPTAWLAIVPTVVLVVLPLIRVVLQKSLRRASFAVALAETTDRSIEAALSHHARGRIAWGSQVVLQSCPRIEQGWTPDDISIKVLPTTFRFPDAATEQYRRWYDDDANRHVRDGTSVRLVHDPSAFTDDDALRLEVEPNRFADAIYFSRRMASDPVERAQHIDRVFSGVVDFPHSFCLHAVIATRDGWVLLTRRSPKVAYHPGAWSCSLEEQLSPRDFEGTSGPVAQRWAERMLNEELGLRQTETAQADVRFLAVFLEGDKINMAMVGLVTLAQDRTTLEAVISARPRQDYEYSDWTFLRWDELPRELATPTRAYHPSAGLRIFLAGLTRFGVYEFGVRLTRAAGASRRRRARA